MDSWTRRRRPWGENNRVGRCPKCRRQLAVPAAAGSARDPRWIRRPVATVGAAGSAYGYGMTDESYGISDRQQIEQRRRGPAGTRPRPVPVRSERAHHLRLALHQRRRSRRPDVFVVQVSSTTLVRGEVSTSRARHDVILLGCRVQSLRRPLAAATACFWRCNWESAFVCRALLVVCERLERLYTPRARAWSPEGFKPVEPGAILEDEGALLRSFRGETGV